MSGHVIAYLQRPRLPIWKHITVARTDSPSFLYASDDERVFLHEVVPCCTLWVISVPYNGWPPELAARIKVIDRGVKASEKGRRLLGKISGLKAVGELKADPALIADFREDIIAAGDPDQSEFFGHNNAERAMLDLTLVRQKRLERLRDLGDRWCPAYGQKFRRPVLVADEGVERDGVVSLGAKPLDALAATAAKTVFISYKWRDVETLGKQRFVLRLAREIARAGMMVWLDKLALPGYAPKGDHDEDEQDRMVRRLLKYGYEHSVALLALGTPNYGRPTKPAGENWTLREWSGDVAPNASLTRVVLPLSRTLPTCLGGYDRLEAGNDPVAAAARVTGWVNEQCG